LACARSSALKKRRTGRNRGRSEVEGGNGRRVRAEEFCVEFGSAVTTGRVRLCRLVEVVHCDDGWRVRTLG
jgi:hypothetical protein